jgi:hypothetical protein
MLLSPLYFVFFWNSLGELRLLVNPMGENHKPMIANRSGPAANQNKYTPVYQCQGNNLQSNQQVP